MEISTSGDFKGFGRAVGIDRRFVATWKVERDGNLTVIGYAKKGVALSPCFTQRRLGAKYEATNHTAWHA